MTDANSPVPGALAGARLQLRDAELLVARANAGQIRRSTDAAMAQTARAALFTEALLQTIHARLAEVKSVTKA